MAGLVVSANFWCWAPALGLLPTSPHFMHHVDELHAAPDKPPSVAIIRFVGDLLKRYPDVSETQLDTAWADGPLIRDASGGFIDFSIRWDYYAKVVPFVTSTARHDGLNCFDPQDSYYYPSSGQSREIARWAVVDPVNDEKSAIAKARHVCALQPHGNGQWHAVLADGSWRVWFGSEVAPTCGFEGASVERSGKSTSCDVSFCKNSNK